MEARAGIEPAYTDLQSAASPLRQRASLMVKAPLVDLSPQSQVIWKNAPKILPVAHG